MAKRLPVGPAIQQSNNEELIPEVSDLIKTNTIAIPFHSSHL